MQLASFRSVRKIGWSTMASDGSQKPAWYGQPFSYMMHPVGGQSHSYGEARGRLPQTVKAGLPALGHSRPYHLTLHNVCRQAEQPGSNQACIALTGEFHLL